MAGFAGTLALGVGVFGEDVKLRVTVVSTPISTFAMCMQLAGWLAVFTMIIFAYVGLRIPLGCRCSKCMSVRK